MGRFSSLRCIVILTIILALFISLALICDDDYSSFDIAYNPDCAAISYYKDLISNALFSRFLAYNSEHPALIKHFIVYLARQEKSPPLGPV